MPDKPSEIASIRRLLNQLEQFSAMRAALPALKAQLSVDGVDYEEIEEILHSLEGVEKLATELANVLDRFNELFTSRGWIAYDRLDPDLARAAIATAESGDMAQAEELLVQYYDAEQIATQLTILSGIKAFKPRLRLAELALADYRAGRYHASIPVVLSLLDGLVNDLGILGFFTQNVDLTAWDCIAANDRGLAELKKLFFKQRSKTTTDPIDVPYRNGILHGMDLGYDNPLVAAKCWAALFATADWARKVEQGKKGAPPPEPEPSWADAIAKVKQVRAERARIEAWKPRENIDVANPTQGSPEAELIAFLSAWIARNYGRMARQLEPFDKKPLNTRAGQVRGYYEHLVLRKFEIKAVHDTAPAVTEIEVRGCGTQFGRFFDSVGTARMVQMDESGQPVVHGQAGGAWFIMKWNPWQP